MDVIYSIVYLPIVGDSMDGTVGMGRVCCTGSTATEDSTFMGETVTCHQQY